MNSTETYRLSVLKDVESYIAKSKGGPYSVKGCLLAKLAGNRLLRKVLSVSDLSIEFSRAINQLKSAISEQENSPYFTLYKHFSDDELFQIYINMKD